MSRAVILPTPASPFHLKYWLKYYGDYIEPYVDTLYVHLNGDYTEREVGALLKEFEPHNALVMFTNKQLEHGIAIDKILDIVVEKNVMLIEDDCFVFAGGFIEKMFGLLESDLVNIIGSKRGSCGNEILQASKTKYNLDYSGLGDSGCNFWPAYFFTNTQALRDTDRHFHAKEFTKGFYCEGLNHTFAETQYGDTFVNTSIQLMAKYPQNKIHYIPQNHASPDDSIWYNKKQGLFNGQAKYIHVGSLSSFNYKTYNKQPLLTREQEKKEWERRVAFYTMFLEFAQPMELADEAQLFRQQLNKLIADLGLSESRVRKYINIYKTLGL